MVLLTMTPLLVEVIEAVHAIQGHVNEQNSAELSLGAIQLEPSKANGMAEHGNKKLQNGLNHQRKPDSEQCSTDPKLSEPSLENPKAGNPIYHGQIIDLLRLSKAQGRPGVRLEDLLRGAKVYVPPPKPKKEPTSEYKALMARLRAEEEARSYERMIYSPPPMDTYSQRFPTSSAAHVQSLEITPSDADDDDVTYADVDRQMALVFNVLVSIVACASAIWVAARWWSTPTRLALSMSGSILVGVAEVVVYSGYIRRVGDAKAKSKQLKEVKEIVNSWAVGGDDTKSLTGDALSIDSKAQDDSDNTRTRRRPNQKSRTGNT